MNSVEWYNLDRGAWEIIGSMNEKWWSHTSVSLPNGVYVVGGYNGEKYLNSVERFDNESN